MMKDLKNVMTSSKVTAILANQADFAYQLTHASLGT
jgi:hypothetical protein